MSPAGSTRRGSRLTIGQVLARLSGDFPGVTISKIRFLEAEGLIRPDRTPSGYRTFSDDHVERLRYILRAQRDQYLPLKVIRDHLDAMDRGLEPPESRGGRPRAPESRPHVKSEVEDVESSDRPPVELRLSRTELLANSGLDDAQLRQLEEFQMVRLTPGTTYYGRGALEVARVAGRFAEHGLEPRHLRLFKTAADRELGLVDQVLAPHRRRRDEEGTRQLARSLVSLSLDLHTALVRSAVDRDGHTQS